MRREAPEDAAGCWRPLHGRTVLAAAPMSPARPRSLPWACVRDTLQSCRAHSSACVCRGGGGGRCGFSGAAPGLGPEPRPADALIRVLTVWALGPEFRVRGVTQTPPMKTPATFTGESDRSWSRPARVPQSHDRITRRRAGRGRPGDTPKPQEGRAAPTGSGWLQGPAGLTAGPEVQTPDTPLYPLRLCCLVPEYYIFLCNYK